MAIRLALGLLFIVNVLRDCSYAHAHQQDWEMDKDKLVVPEDTVSAKKELVASCTRKLGGRKMGAHEVLMRRKFKKDTSGANCSDIKYSFQVKGDFIRAKYKSENRSLKKEELKEADFVAFGDDYHGPKHHSPKNN